MPDTFAEINGVARTSRLLAAFARVRGRPFLCVSARDRHAPRAGEEASDVELVRSRCTIPLEADLSYDLLHWRHIRRVGRALDAFRPDLIHITGPSDMGQLGAWFAWRLRIPLVASWHTNVHEFAALRVRRVLGALPPAARRAVERWVERGVLLATARFYRLARVALAPNPALVAQLHALTGRPVWLMRRGIDAARFSPAHRDTPADGVFRIGYVGRLSPEKDVRALVALDERMRGAATRPYAFVVVGDGRERDWLQRHLPSATFTGMLHGEALARAYASFDVFYFPSRTDTFGNVVLEALASGTPAIVTPYGGPPTIVDDGVTGFVTAGDAAACEAVLALMRDPSRHARMRLAARAAALHWSWESVFDTVYAAYAQACGSAAPSVDRAAGPSAPEPGP